MIGTRNTAAALMAVVAAVSAFVGLSAPAMAAVLVEEGPDYHIISYEAGIDDAGNYIGMVTLKVQTIFESGRYKVRTTIVGVSVDPGWSYSIVKPGGVESTVSVDFTRQKCTAQFRATYKAGKTVIDGGRLRCR